ncbi:unnamed protein product [Haemonchus placei]|uniref:Selenoprotein F n=1 Tax=Haemonchus placei TaxID=6290 RepID=A0A158QLC5_HAEPC|nr:unnamed protein product [Haemonchus placei]
MRRLLIGVILFVLASAEYVKYELTYEECKEAGFVPESLKCSSCRPLPKFNLEFLLSDCLACCTKDEEDHPNTVPWLLQDYNILKWHEFLIAAHYSKLNGIQRVKLSFDKMIQTYPYADIEVCDCNLARFPQAQAFVQENMAAPWGDSVRVRQVRGITPQIVLKDHSGKRIQTYNIEKWDTDTIKEFLTEFIE